MDFISFDFEFLSSENKQWKLLFFKINKPRKLFKEFTG